ncbi:MAG: right-handed parallel beta-helix repeat-containing protein [Thermoguttaceae bacterium]|nr:right-handed parallel beta-helix repeat-containing protein [Thermoguttaceae bacterium]
MVAFRRLCACLAVAGCALRGVSAATLEVGPGKRFARIEEANAAAAAGDEILVHPLSGDEPYRRAAVFVRQPRLAFRAVPAAGRNWVRISGEGFDYSGRGSTPRAIFQFNAGADGCLVEGFELAGARNGAHNGAGVRINQASFVTVRRCNIHDNDMGIMSGGDGSPDRARGQRIEHCLIHHNGSLENPGYNHNLYLGGTSAVLRFCEVHHSLTGHNVKSRAHHTRVEACYIHDSANREFDLVDAADTQRPGSHAVISGCIIVKDPAAKGNRAVLHFGQDGGREHDGTLVLAFNTIVTPFLAPVVELSSPKATALLVGNLVSDGGNRQAKQRVVLVRAGATMENVPARHNRFSGGFSPPAGARFDPATNLFQRIAEPLFASPEDHNYRLRPEVVARLTLGRGASRSVPEALGGDGARQPLGAWEYVYPADKQPRAAAGRQTAGAY